MYYLEMYIYHNSKPFPGSKCEQDIRIITAEMQFATVPKLSIWLRD